jgi:leucyl-tRNA synthetase
MLSPFVPHFSEELWQRLENKESIIKTEWSKYDPNLIVEEKITIVIQVNGKLRSKIEVSPDIPEDRLKELVLADQKLKPWIQNQPLKKFIVVPNRLVNIVV